MSERRAWKNEVEIKKIQEDQMLVALIREYGMRRWANVAHDMQKAFPKRTSKQIRERWHNHLDPSIRKESWTKEEEIILFNAQNQYGCKWKDIAKLFIKRTDNAVKNHFYSTVRKTLRRMYKLLGNKNCTTYMRSLKPSVLVCLFQSSSIKNLISRFHFSDQQAFLTSDQRTALTSCFQSLSHLKCIDNTSLDIFEPETRLSTPLECLRQVEINFQKEEGTQEEWQETNLFVSEQLKKCLWEKQEMWTCDFVQMEDYHYGEQEVLQINNFQGQQQETDTFDLFIDL